MNMRSVLLGMVALVAGGNPVQAEGPVGELFLTTGNEVFVVRGTSIVRSWRAVGQGLEFALAVADDVRTVGHRRTIGARYALDGEDLNDRYQIPRDGPPWVFDGTTDGGFNYILSLDGVWRFDQVWGDGARLFAIDQSRGNITYDTQNDTLWVVRGSPDAVEERTMAGELLRSFDPGFQNLSALALDPSDGTLWMGQQSMPGILHQFTRDGEPLQTVSISGLPEVLGGEFRIVSSRGCVRDPRWVCDGDVDGDGQVNPVDSGLVQAAFGSADEQDLCNYDVDCDGQINPVDAGIVQSLFGTCDPPRDSCP